MEVTVYGRSGCPQCEETVARMRRRGIRPRVLDVGEEEAGRQARRLADTLGSRRLPVVAAGGSVWSGYRPDRIDEAAGRQRREVEAGRGPDVGADRGLRP